MNKYVLKKVYWEFLIKTTILSKFVLFEKRTAFEEINSLNNS
ncbi:hypothetical protein PRV_00195 [Mycoplasma parvum str. Indiana]|uniref:Uncharacterized protein n=1 Tax=Mycoplasma parvum str. Indiana TaxID=1403316 RepID=U5NFA0_9MOLU|nr:hypothetical protein PRV_00195 [Mycoplasma parvum str. Indiana]